MRDLGGMYNVSHSHVIYLNMDIFLVNVTFIIALILIITALLFVFFIIYIYIFFYLIQYNLCSALSCFSKIFMIFVAARNLLNLFTYINKHTHIYVGTNLM